MEANITYPDAGLQGTCDCKGNVTASWLSSNPSFVALLVINTVLTLVVACVITVCVLWYTKRRGNQREERNKLGGLLQKHYWSQEERITNAQKVLVQMKQNVIFRDVTELHLLGYKYRCERHVYENATSCSPALWLASVQFLNTLRNIERLFDSLSVQLPCQGRCSHQVSTAVSSVLTSLALNTTLLWSDQKTKQIRRLLRYFAGRWTAEQFEGASVSDDDLEALVFARAPYANQLYLNADHFVLADIDLVDDVKVDWRNKISYVDIVLAKRSSKLLSKQKELREYYYGARELCIVLGLVHNKHHLPDVGAEAGQDGTGWQCVTLLRHLLRLLCMNKNLRKLEGEDKFWQLLVHVYETLSEVAEGSGAALDLAERSRDNMVANLRALTREQILVDKDLTKARLELMERELVRHIGYLRGKERRHVLGNAARCDPLTANDGHASMLSANAGRRRGEGGRGQDWADGGMLEHQHSLDQTSLLSGSSVYGTAASLYSGTEATPLMTGHSPPPAPRDLDPGSPSDSTEGNDYFETAV